MPEECRELVTPSMLGIATAIACTFAALFAILGPLNTHHTLSLHVRLYISVLNVALDLMIWYGGLLLTLYLMRSRTTQQTALSLVPMGVILSGPFTAVAYTVHHLVEPKRLLPIEALPSLYLLCLVALIGGSATLYHVLHLRVSRLRTAGSQVVSCPSAHSSDDATGASVPPMTTPPGTVGTQSVETGQTGVGVTAESMDQDRLEPEVRFLQRLPENVSRDIIYLKASGHYVEVITSAGSAIIPMRFVDAVAELGSSGMRIHRSFWAAYGHVTGLLRRGRRVLLGLTDGHELPISRSSLPVVRRAVARLDIAWRIDAGAQR